ncbi:hypothetical protein Tam10B_1253 [Bifidobacterium vansinderenii]|uniref:PIN domain-containing protein n=1 Tax=Bifidobacterium vansinderenii TaxID=1984871 RepID=A0A229VXP1_9BIFI|nr:hypothetical protein Tam10B_1253 [Bifidobacterium vansinderenii]
MPQKPTVIVVPDVNVYLTAACQLDRGFSMEGLAGRLKEAKSRRNDSDVFCALSTLLEPLPDGSAVEIYSGEHIVETAIYKACQPKYGLTPEDVGLGWKGDEAQSIADMVYSLVKTTGGSVLPRNGSILNPPLDYEDGSVMRCLADARHESALCRRVCLTYDHKMIHVLQPRLGIVSPPMEVISPENWCSQVRASRFSSIYHRMCGLGQ